MQKAIARMSENTLPVLFTKNFMRTWINHLSKRDRYLHKVAIQTVCYPLPLFLSLNGSAKADVLQKIVKENPELGFAVILQITGVHGSQQFDKLTNTKIVESILTAMDVEGIHQYIQYLMKQVNHFDGIDK